jgi:sec-independent protein translocase protein TatA
MNELSPWHLIIVLLIFALLFGSRKLPDAARGIGRSLRIFRAEMQGVRDDATAPSAPAPVQDAVPPMTPEPAPAPPVDAVPPVSASPVSASTAEPVKPVVD